MSESSFSPEIAEVRTDEQVVHDIAQQVQQAGGRAFLVGGLVRDKVMQRFGKWEDSKDFDLEVYGLAPDRLQELLAKHGPVDEVGKSFGILKMFGRDIEVSVPRRDSKSGEGHRGFTVDVDPNMSIEDAARRRDLTINSMMLDPLTGEIIDPYGGIDDIEKKLIRATDFELFKDDPLRVLRVAQFAARFGFGVDPETAELCRSIELSSLSKERVTEEFKKLLLKSEKPSVGLQVANEIGVIEKLFPELQALQGTEQEPDWHPEGDVWTHTLMAVDTAVTLFQRKGAQFLPSAADPTIQAKVESYCADTNERLVVLLAALCHDLGKPETTRRREVRGEMRTTAYGHDKVGEGVSREFLKKFTFGKDIEDKVASLVRAHMFPSQNPDVSDKALLRLADRLYPATMYELVLVGASDSMGRGVEDKSYPEGYALLQKAEKWGVTEGKPALIITGADLIRAGVPRPKGGPEGHRFGEALREVQQRFLNNPGLTKEDALRHALDLLDQ